MIANTLGRSDKFNALPSNRARLLYVLALTHADAEGRIEAHPSLLKADCFPLDYGVTPEHIWSDLVAIATVGLIRLYEVDGKRYAEFDKFHEHNTISRHKEGDDKGKPNKEAWSKLPPPTQGTALPLDAPESLRSESGATPEQVRPNRIEVQSQSELKRREEHSSDSEELAERPNTQVAQARRAHIDYQEFIDTWNQQAPGLPAVQKLNEARRRGIQKLCKEHGIAEALGLLHDAARQVAGDEFWIERQYGLDNLLKPGRTVEKAEKFRATNGMKPSEIRLAKEAQGWLAATGGSHGN